MEKYEPEKYDYYFDCGVCRVANGTTECYIGDGEWNKIDVDVIARYNCGLDVCKVSKEFFDYQIRATDEASSEPDEEGGYDENEDWDDEDEED